MTGLFQQIKDFFEIPFNKYLVVGLLLIGLLIFLNEAELFAKTAGPPEVSETNFTVHFFYMPTCSHCAEQKPVNEEIMRDYPDVPFVYHDVTQSSEYGLFTKMAEEHNLDVSTLGVPTTFVGKQVFVGFESRNITGAKIRSAIEFCVNQCINQTPEAITASEAGLKEFTLPFLGKTDLTGFSLPALAIILGLIDGFNPCAMWVLVYMISLLMGVNDRKRIWIIAGSFVLASGILYFLFMAAWLNAFLLLSYFRPITIIVGLIALGGGILSVKEYIETKGQLVCKIEDEEGKKKTMTQVEELISAPLTFAVVIGIVVLAFVINSVEFVCSSAIPAVFTQILALSNLSAFEHYLYILLYDIFFMLDDLIVFGLAAFAVSGGFGEKYARYCKIIGGIILVSLGAVLLFAPQMLR
jgi:thiol-disulfide isomerase/thioredoxin